jgi:hypothetical protein
MPAIPFFVGGLLWLFRGEILAIIVVAMAWHFRWILLGGLGLVVGGFVCLWLLVTLSEWSDRKKAHAKEAHSVAAKAARRAPTSRPARIEPIPPTVELDPVIADYEARKAAYFRGEGPPP